MNSWRVSVRCVSPAAASAAAAIAAQSLSRGLRWPRPASPGASAPAAAASASTASLVPTPSPIRLAEMKTVSIDAAVIVFERRLTSPHVSAKHSKAAFVMREWREECASAQHEK